MSNAAFPTYLHQMPNERKKKLKLFGNCIFGRVDWPLAPHQAKNIYIINLSIFCVALTTTQTERRRENSRSFDSILFVFGVWRLLSALPRPLLVCFHHYIIKILMENNNSSMFLNRCPSARPHAMGNVVCGRKSRQYFPLLIRIVRSRHGRKIHLFCRPHTTAPSNR